MKIGPLQITWHPPVTVQIYLFYPELDEAELDEALDVHDTHPLWRAVMQLLNEAREDCYEQAETYIDNQSRRLGQLAGAEKLMSFRKFLVDRREQAHKTRQ